MIIGLVGTIIGLAMLIWGANLLVDGAAGLAKKAGINGHIIGVTLVATATSLPELATAVSATIRGNYAIAMGNVVGSNAFNVGIVLAVGVIILPIVSDKLVIRDGWVVIISTIIFALFAIGGIERWQAGILLMIYLIYVFYLYRSTKIEPEITTETKKYFALFLMLIVGCALLFAGSPILVISAERLSEKIGVEDSVIALTLIALGTSLPELLTAVIAAIKGHEGIAIGNVLGSNLFNILLIPGIAALIHPLDIDAKLAGALIPAMLLITLIGVVLSRKRMGRKEGILLLISYVFFLILIFV